MLLRTILVCLLGAFCLLSSCLKDRLYSPKPPENTVPEPAPVDSGKIFINEIMASSGGGFPDPADGASDDWFEIYNSGSSPIDLSGWAFSDDASDLNKSVLPDNNTELTVPAKGYLVFWADDTPDQGARHLSFKLSSTNGDKLFLTKSNGTIADSLSFGPQTQEVSYGRMPDGGNNWQTFSQATPGRKNQ
jgi:hypothetical protein